MDYVRIVYIGLYVHAYYKYSTLTLSIGVSNSTQLSLTEKCGDEAGAGMTQTILEYLVASGPHLWPSQFSVAIVTGLLV